MPVLDGISATRKIKQDNPDIKILILTSYKDEDNIASALAAGANAYCMKDIQISRLIEVMQMVSEGATWFDPGVQELLTKLILKNTNGGDARPPDDANGTEITADSLNDLTPREIDVLELIARGKSNKDIAEELVLSISTVKIHVSNILRKLNAGDRTQLAIKALQERLVRP
jgi:DNA-binding NarL/FixJ family response regulator